MQVIGFQEAGGPDVLQPFDVADPQPQAGEVLIRVHAATVNPTDTMRRSGQRAATDAKPQVPGMDIAGVVEQVGPGTTTDLMPGDAVMAIVVPDGTHGGYSEQLALPVESVTRIPRGASFAEAATIPMNGLTARLALDTLNLSPGQVLAVTGAAGAMGGYAVQLAKQDGLTVVADAAAKDRELVTELGADLVLERGEEFADRVREHHSDGVDGLIDGAVLTTAITPAVRDGATVITIRGYDEPGERGVRFHPILVVDYATEQAKLDRLREQAEAGQITMRVADELAAEQAPTAHRRLAEGGVRGRLVLKF